MKIGLSSDELSLIELSTIAYWNTIRPRLLRVPGVANVAIWGERPGAAAGARRPRADARPRRLAEQVMEVTADALDAGLLRTRRERSIGTGGFIDTPNQRLGDPARAADLDAGRPAEVSFEAAQDGKPIRLADVADVVDEHQPLIGDAIINDGPGLLLDRREVPLGPTRSR